VRSEGVVELDAYFVVTFNGVVDMIPLVFVERIQLNVVTVRDVVRISFLGDFQLLSANVLNPGCRIPLLLEVSYWKSAKEGK